MGESYIVDIVRITLDQLMKIFQGDFGYNRPPSRLSLSPFPLVNITSPLSQYCAILPIDGYALHEVYIAIYSQLELFNDGISPQQSWRTQLSSSVSRLG